MDVITKVCTKCDKEKTLEEFNKQKIGKHGRRATCRECQKVQHAKYRTSEAGREVRSAWKKTEKGRECEKRYRGNPVTKKKVSEYVRTEDYKIRHRQSADRQRFGGNRIKALERDGFKCVSCGSEEKLQVHHRDEMGRNKPKEKMNNDLSNLTTLCAKCHIEQHNPVIVRWTRRAAK